MEAFISKLSLYDILVMVIPGGILLWCLSEYFPETSDFSLSFIGEYGKSVFVTVFLIAAYVVGIFNHIITHKLWHPFRNSPELLIKSLRDNLNQFEEMPHISSLFNNHIPDVDNTRVFTSEWQFVFITALGIVTIAGFTSMLFSLQLTSNKAITLLPLAFLLFWFLYGFFCKTANLSECENNSHTRQVLSAYDKAYYFALKNAYSSDIPVVEGQAAFLQSLLIPLAFVIASPNDTIYFSINETVKLLLFIIYICLFPTIFNRMELVHSRVWEDYEFLKYYNRDDSDSQSNQSQ